MDSITADRRPTILTIVVTLWVLSAVAVGLRILVRHVTHQALWWDDWLALGSWITFTPKAVMFMISVVSLGAGKHAALVSAANYQQFLKYVYWVGLVYPVAISMAKASIILLYLRLFGVQKYFARTCYFLLGITFCWGISILFTSIFQCTPIHAAWRNVPNATCIKVKLFFYCSIIPDCLLDALIFIMPLYPIWKLKLPVTKKVQITGALILGASEIVFSIARLITYTRLTFVDATWGFYGPIIWATVEESVAIICICIPVMAPMLRLNFWKFRASNNREHVYAVHTPSSKDSRFQRLINTPSVEVKAIRKTTEYTVDNNSMTLSYEEQWLEMNPQPPNHYVKAI